MKLRTKFVLMLSLFALLPALVVGTITIVIAGNKSIADAQDSAKQMLELAEGGTISIIEMVERINQQTGNENLLKSFLTSDRITAAEVNQRLKEITDTYPVLDNAILTNKEGVVVASDDESMIGFDCNQAWPEVMKQAISTNQQVLSTGTKNVLSGNVMLVMATPVTNGLNVEGYFITAVSVLEIYNKVIAKAKIMDSGYIYVVEPDGTMLMHPNTEILLDKESFNSLPIADTVKMSPHGSGKYTFNGETKYYIYDTESNGWIYVAVMPQNDVENLAKTIVNLLSIITGIIFVMGPFVAIAFANGIIKPILKVSDGIKQLFDGDFTYNVEIKSKNELGQMAEQLNETTNHLSEIVGGVKNTSGSMGEQSDALAIVSKEMSTAINDLVIAIDTISQGSTTQANDLQDTLEMLIELESEMADIEQNLNDVAGSAVNAQSKAVNGQNIVNELAEAIKDIRETFELFRNKISNLGNTVSEISNITDAINAISSQTNLLALNASIEAARAGEMGKGFAVVAGEVGNLAEQSRKSAAEISVLIKNVNMETDSVVKDSAHVETLLEEQSKVIENVMEAFRATLESIQVAEPIIKDTFGALNIAEKAGHTVRERSESIASVSEEIMASTERISATSEELLATSEGVAENAAKASVAAEHLNETMSKFKCN